MKWIVIGGYFTKIVLIFSVWYNDFTWRDKMIMTGRDKKIRFVCDNEEGVIDQSGYVRWGGWGFHLEDIKPDKILTNALEDAYLKALFDSIRI